MVKPFLEMTDEDWHGLLAANLHGYYYGCRAAITADDRPGRGGRIDQRHVRRRHPADRRPLGVRHGEGRDPRADEDAGRRVRPAPDHRQRALARGDRHAAEPGRLHARRCAKTYNERIPLGRIASAEEIADPFLFLASDASRYVTGHRARRRRRHRPERQRRPREDARVMATATTTLENFIGGRWVRGVDRRDAVDDLNPADPARRARPRAAVDGGGRRGGHRSGGRRVSGVEGDVADPPRPDLRAGVADRSRSARRRSPG